MELTTVESSNIEAVGYDEFNSDLIIKFKNGLYYKYSGVPYSIYTNLMKARSKGAFFNANVRGTYDYETISVDEN